jgi:hypothetical protein
MFISKSLYFYVRFLRIFFSHAAELLALAGRKILERGGNTAWCMHPRFSYFTAQFCWKTRLLEKKISATFEKFLKMRYFARIDDILIQVKAILGPRYATHIYFVSLEFCFLMSQY